MYLESLHLVNFRNYEKEFFTFSEGVNLIGGSNAQGKTNLLEAIYFLSTGRSFRTPYLQELIREGANFFYLEGQFFKEGVLQSVKVTFDGVTRKMQYNGSAYSTFTHLFGLLPTVLYAPEDGILISGSPSDRRRLLDLHLAQSDPVYIHHLSRYFKAMKQRNYLLKQRNSTAIAPWEHALAVSAAYLIRKRKEAVSELNPLLAHHMQKLSQEHDRLETRYHSSFALKEDPDEWSISFEQQLRKERPKEMQYGNTSIGPHRDDLLIYINQKPAKTFASEGQKQSAVISLRLAEWERLHQRIGSSPLMSIDDFGIHLDEKRKTLLQQQLACLGQVFLTTPMLQENLHLPFVQKVVFVIDQGQIISSSEDLSTLGPRGSF